MTALSGSSQPIALQLVLACDLAAVRPTTQAVRRFLAEHGCGEEDLADCELALVEACNNAIQYAAPGARQQPVLIEALCGQNAIELRVTDHSPGFEWPAQVTLPDSESEHGRGLFLIDSLMDQVSYLRRSGENTLVLHKCRTIGDSRSG